MSVCCSKKTGSRRASRDDDPGNQPPFAGNPTNKTSVEAANA